MPDHPPHISRITLSMLVSAASLCLAPGSHAAGQVSAALLAKLQRAEQSRGDLGLAGLQWVVKASNTVDGETKNATIRAITQGGNAFAEFLAPESAVGKKYIVADGKMWFYKTGLSRALPVSKRQRLMGNASIGDVASTSFLINYRVESASGAKVDGEDCHLFILKKNSGRASYGTVRYWVSAARQVGVKAEFKTTSGKVVRTASMKYENSLSLGGKTIPMLSEMTVNEMIGSSKVTRLTFSQLQQESFPETLFDASLLRSERGKKPGRPRR